MPALPYDVNESKRKIRIAARGGIETFYISFDARSYPSLMDSIARMPEVSEVEVRDWQTLVHLNTDRSAVAALSRADRWSISITFYGSIAFRVRAMAGWVINQAGSFIAPDTAPVWAEAIFNLLLPRKDRDFVLGDLREGFQVQAKRYGKAYAQLDYIIGGILAIVDSRTIGLVRRLFKKD